MKPEPEPRQILKDFAEYFKGVMENLWGDWNKSENPEQFAQMDLEDAVDNFLKGNWRDKLKKSKESVSKQENYLEGQKN